MSIGKPFKLADLLPTSKIGKQAVLYLHAPNTQYQCKDCTMFLAASTQCTIHGPSDVIQPYGSCGFFVPGQAVPGSPMSGVTKIDSGYAENQPGFSCKRCDYFIPRAWDCEAVDKSSLGADAGMIHPDACCNNWEVET